MGGNERGEEKASRERWPEIGFVCCALVAGSDRDELDVAIEVVITETMSTVLGTPTRGLRVCKEV